MQFFTICSRNFIAQAYTLYESIVTHHPDASFAVALCDEVGDFDVHGFPFRIIPFTELGIDTLEEMIDRYNITELNTSIKPFVFNYLHEEAPGAPVVYFDPDILVTAPLVEMVEALEAGADCVLTPHMIEPSEWAEMHEGRILQYGIYNLGFIALRATPEVQRICHWWARRLQTECIIDLSRGIFVDQKWADLLPAFISNTYILRHPGYNVAYWNLSHRRIMRDGGKWCVNGVPLRFFHFSGSVLSDQSVFSRHSSFYVKGGLRLLDDLFAQYCATVNANGLAYYQAEFPYAYRWCGSSGKNEHTPEGVSTAAPSKDAVHASILSKHIFPHLPAIKVKSKPEFEIKQSALECIEAARRNLEDTLVLQGDSVRIPGYCVVCGRQSDFFISSVGSPENLQGGQLISESCENVCHGCGLTDRIRAVLHVMHQMVPPSSTDHIHLTEQGTPLFSWLNRHYGNVTGSELFSPNYSSGSAVNGHGHEGIQNIGIPDKSFNLIVSLGMLEQISSPDAAFRQLRRCLCDTGVAMISVPFTEHSAHAKVRSRITGISEGEHLMKQSHHDHPNRLDGNAMYPRYFGWNVLDELKSAGFSRAEVVFFWSRRFGYLGNLDPIILAYA